jgi:hypothetical protein
MGKQSCVHLLLGACAGLASFVSVFVLLSGHLHKLWSTIASGPRTV